MPFSKSTYDQWISDLVKMLKPGAVLDIGAGAGKYGRLIMEAGLEPPGVHVTALEVDRNYIKAYKLEDFYDKIYCVDVMRLIDDPSIRYDLIIMGDVIEHLRKSDGVDLLNFLIHRSGYIVVVYPDKYPQDDWDGHMQEAHISVWSDHDFAGLDVIHKFHDGMHLWLVKGYLPTTMTITG